MKNFKFILSIVLSLFVTSSYAQFANTGAKSITTSSSTADVTPYSRFSVSYNPITWDADGDDLDLTGISLEYTKAISISATTPLFLEIGARGTYAWGSEKYEYNDAEYTYVGLTIPFNLAYKFSVSETFSIIPFAGITLKGNLVAKYYYNGHNYDFFDDDDVENTFNRFQIGYQIGANLQSKKFLVGLHYGKDFGELGKKIDSSQYGLSIGVFF